MGAGKWSQILKWSMYWDSWAETTGIMRLLEPDFAHTETCSQYMFNLDPNCLSSSSLIIRVVTAQLSQSVFSHTFSVECCVVTRPNPSEWRHLSELSIQSPCVVYAIFNWFSAPRVCHFQFNNARSTTTQWIVWTVKVNENQYSTVLTVPLWQ